MAQVPGNAERQAKAAKATTGEVLPGDGSVNQHTPKEGSEIATPTQEQRARQAGISKRQQEKYDALARKSPALLNAVRAGEVSCHRADRLPSGHGSSRL